MGTSLKKTPGTPGILIYEELKSVRTSVISVPSVVKEK
jgi:hypothetical protein